MSKKSSKTIPCVQLWDDHTLKIYVIVNKHQLIYNHILKRLKQNKFYFKDCVIFHSKDCVIFHSDLYYNVKSAPV